MNKHPMSNNITQKAKMHGPIVLLAYVTSKYQKARFLTKIVMAQSDFVLQMIMPENKVHEYLTQALSKCEKIVEMGKK